mmetsp:Transcript_1844/g.2655  ORF Transcript_1844/g.2655 Transcript_1844/m.2655 type:complete len:138 (+) Transcript_1844:127-540(+)|eukprot:CAMPEP_0184862806 /NCGR_PEP_ID=MMETSP0580-20130426/7853_1 /TAXON_ID=1118495 /ORGANISM="Dactyliosolen fragilissimus" /LENGTH=137 /DNA_ID=CAMNT_0027360801 /DNA_START=40 /DNA_END=453 /DNA_ORIENTATION=-
MKFSAAFGVLSMAAGASAFGVSMTPSLSRSTSIFGMPPVDEMTETQLGNQKKADRWNEIRLLSDEEAEAQLSEEELESFKSYHSDVKEDIEKMKKIAELMLKDLEPPKVKPKSKGQKKRDAWARRQARDAANAAANA